MNRNIIRVVDQILDEDSYARENDNYLIVKVAQRVEPELAGSKFMELSNSKICMETITRERRKWVKDHKNLMKKETIESRTNEELIYHSEYSR